MNVYDLIAQGEEKWFEYHCNESHNSADAELWYRSHQKVKILRIDNLQDFHESTTMEERLEDMGSPIVYNIRFEDGFEGSAFEDELLNSPEEYCRKDPSKRKGIKM